MKYRPSNGTEGMSFIEFFCSNCLYDVNEDCDILARSMGFDIDDEEYPEEWQTIDNKNLCTKFHHKEVPLPEIIDPNQLSLLEDL